MPTQPLVPQSALLLQAIVTQALFEQMPVGQVFPQEPQLLPLFFRFVSHPLFH
jgi:hypothetical protein